jgi:GH15 family glucan-1,4-alpha-glucosidase
LPDSGISVMAWVAFDRAVKSAECHGLKGPVERWRTLRDEIHREVCARGVDHDRGVFVHAFGGKALDAALLRVPLIGFFAARR